jgi:C-terminal processing protease CtpA/Prc
MKINNIFKNLAVLGLLSSLVLGGCKHSVDPGPDDPWEDVVGIWKQQGYGNIMQIEENTYSLFELNQVTCLKKGTWSLDSLDASLRNIQKNNSLDHFDLEYLNSNTLQRFDKVTTLPTLCDNGGTAFSSNPEVNFDAMWHTFNEQYAFFEQRNVDWDEQYGNYRQLVNPETTDDELFQIFSDMLATLNDGHTSVTSDNQAFQAGVPSMLLQRVFQEFSEQSEITDLEQYIEQELLALDNIVVSYLSGVVSQGANDRLAWGNLTPNVGYLMIREMTNFVYNATPETSDQANINALEPVIANAMSNLANTQAIVIDLRLNGGGQAKSALSIAGHFTNQTTPAFSVKARFENAFTETQVINLQPVTTNGYTGDVLILTSGITASAAEILVLSMLERGQVTIVGETTEGILSNKLQKRLPNNWNFTLSNEVYQSIEGSSPEVVGIIPDIQQVVFPKDDRNNNIDSGLDTALDILSNRGIY